MTEAKSPREIAEQLVVDYLEATRRKLAEMVESALLSYAAERERLLAEADSVIDHLVHDREWLRKTDDETVTMHAFQAIERHQGRGCPECPKYVGTCPACHRPRPRLRSHPATEGKR